MRLPTGAAAGESETALGVTTVNAPRDRSFPLALSTKGPVVPSIGTWMTIIASDHWAIVAGRPLNVTASSGPFVAKPFPNNTTLVPTGPLTGSTRIDGMIFSCAVLLMLYSTGAQQEPSGSGSDEARRTTTSPVCALAGTSMSIFSFRQRRIFAGTPLMRTSLTPNMVLGSFEPAVLVKWLPVISTTVPGSTSGGDTWRISGRVTENDPTGMR